MNAKARHHHDAVRIGLLIGAIAAGPAAWVLQLVAGYGIASLACFPHDQPYLTSPPPGWGGEPALLLAINLACLTLALAGGFYCQQRRRPVGRDAARERFMATCGVIGAAIFCLAILFDTPALLGAPACWSIPS